MDREIHTANMLGIAVIDANQIKRHLEYEEKRQERVASDYASCISASVVTSVDYVALWGMRTAVPPALAQLHINGLMSMP